MCVKIAFFVCVCAVSSIKLATESAWSALLSRRFHSIMVLGKKVFVLGIVAEWDT